MTDISDIPVLVELGKENDRKEANLAVAKMVLNEVRTAIAEWIASGQENAIDLKNVPPMRAETYQYLRDVLSAGEVTAVIEADLRVDISETGYPGVWWVTHYNDKGAIVTEIIEITAIPAILKAHPVEADAGLKRLDKLLLEPAECEGSSISLN